MVAKAETISESRFRWRFLRSGLRNFRAGSDLHSAALPPHARCTMRDAECWRSPAGGKKQYYLDQEIALYLLGSGNNGRYYDATTGRFLSEDPTRQDGTSKDSNSQLLAPNSSADVNLYCYTGNDPVNNLDPSGHSLVTDPPKRDFHPVQNQPTQQHNANVHSKVPATGHGQLPTTPAGGSARASAPAQPTVPGQVAIAKPAPTPPPVSQRASGGGAQPLAPATPPAPATPIPWGYMGMGSMPVPAYQALVRKEGSALNFLQGPANAALTMAQTEPPQEREPMEIVGGVLKGAAEAGKAIEDAVPAANDTTGAVVKGASDVGRPATDSGALPGATTGAKVAEKAAKSALQDVPEGVLKNEQAQADLVKTQQADLKQATEDAKAAGGSAKVARGRVLAEQGKEAENISRSTLEHVPHAKVLENQRIGKGVGSRIDNIVSGNGKRVYVETKLTISKVYQRTVNQLANAVRAASKSNATVILQVARQPTGKEIAALQKALGRSTFSKVTIVSTQIDLFKAVEAALK